MRNNKGQFIPGNIPWHKGSKGKIRGYWKGKNRPEIRSWLPSKHSLKTIEKIKKARKRQGGNVWIKGKKGLHLSVITEFKKGQNIGLNNINWKGGITPLVLQIRHCFEYRQWRSDVFHRDNFICVLCGYSKGSILQADHYPKLFSEIIKEYNIKTFNEALICEELWDINNGRTLCKNCHIKYGKKHNKK